MSEAKHTVETLRDYVLSQVQNLDQRLTIMLNANKAAADAALEAAKVAVLKAEAASDKRFENVNEFRATLADQQRTLIPRTEVEASLRAIDFRIVQLEERLQDQSSRDKGGKEGYSNVIAIIGVVSLVIGIVLSIYNVVKH